MKKPYVTYKKTLVTEVTTGLASVLMYGQEGNKLSPYGKPLFCPGYLSLKDKVWLVNKK